MSEGYIGEISGVLVAAAVEAIVVGHERIDKRILDQTEWVAPSDRRKELRV